MHKEATVLEGAKDVKPYKLKMSIAQLETSLPSDTNLG